MPTSSTGAAGCIEQLLARWAATNPEPAAPAERFLAVVGPSGSGKSSVVKAGLLPALRAGALPGSETWFVAEMVPGNRPYEELEKALLPVAVDPPARLQEALRRDERGLIRTLRPVLPAGDDEQRPQLLLIIDQFEELYTLVEERGDRAAHLSIYC